MGPSAPCGFPGLIAPASLKHPRGSCRPARAPWFSGVNRPGLIEAGSLTAGRFNRLRGFPGLIAPASLKLPRIAALNGVDRAGFPGLIAPASLKQPSFRRTFRRSSGFPGLIAPASLKPSGLNTHCPRIRRFSGVNRPGLIEAARIWRTISQSRGRFSGVNRPGLIEAACAADLPLKITRVFRG